MKYLSNIINSKRVKSLRGEEMESLNGSSNLSDGIPILRRSELDMSVNIGFMVIFIATISSTGILLGYALAYSN